MPVRAHTHCSAASRPSCVLCVCNASGLECPPLLLLPVHSGQARLVDHSCAAYFQGFPSRERSTAPSSPRCYRLRMPLSDSFPLPVFQAVTAHVRLLYSWHESHETAESIENILLLIRELWRFIAHPPQLISRVLPGAQTVVSN